jgi:hypothetical protein
VRGVATRAKTFAAALVSHTQRQKALREAGALGGPTRDRICDRLCLLRNFPEQSRDGISEPYEIYRGTDALR